MKFSIITPSYNQGRFIRDCIESVLNQTNIEFEHIIVDAGSNDETIDILKSYQHLIWTSEPDQGMSDGINKGFLQATGDLLMWLNCDDYLLPNALERVSTFIQNNPNFDIYHGDCIYIKEDKTIIRRKYDTPIDEWDLLFVGCIIPSTSAFYRKKIIDDGILLDLSYRNCMDWEYYLRILRSGFRFKYIPESLAYFRWYNDSTTLKNWQRMIDEGFRCQRIHIQSRKLPNFLLSNHSLHIMKRIFQIRRIAKRVIQHKRIW